MPNRGRNFSAVLSGPVAALARTHDLLLHVHGKRSPHAPANTGEQWRQHLWIHLVGDGFSVGDQIIAEFAASPRLGLVAPEDRRLPDWDGSRGFVSDWLQRLDPELSTRFEIPTHFDFPVGAMFWARSSALRPFLNLNLAADDFPAEPLR